MGSKTRNRKSQLPNFFFFFFEIKVFNFLYHNFSSYRVIVNRSESKLVCVDEYLNCEMVRGKQKSNRKDKESPKQKGQKIKWGRRERDEIKVIKKKREREKKAKKERKRRRKGRKGR